MVILIGGVGCAGKTVMAQRLLEKYHMPYLSIDHLKMGIIRGKENLPSQNLAEESVALKVECEKYGAKYFGIAHDYEKEMGEVFAWLGGEIAKKLPRGTGRGLIARWGRTNEIWACAHR